jgi:hypothetical protein
MFDCLIHYNMIKLNIFVSYFGQCPAELCHNLATGHLYLHYYISIDPVWLLQAIGCRTSQDTRSYKKQIPK